MVLLSLQGKNLILTICALILILIFLVMLIITDYELFNKRLLLGDLNKEVRQSLSCRDAYFKDVRDKKIFHLKNQPIVMARATYEQRLSDDIIQMNELYFDKVAYIRKHRPIKLTGMIISYTLDLSLFIFSLVLILAPGVKESIGVNDFLKHFVSFIGSYEFLSCMIAICIALIILDYYSHKKDLDFYKYCDDYAELTNQETLDNLGDTNIIHRT